jgi:hypothetical protein
MMALARVARAMRFRPTRFLWFFEFFYRNRKLSQRGAKRHRRECGWDTGPAQSGRNRLVRIGRRR